LRIRSERLNLALFLLIISSNAFAQTPAPNDYSDPKSWLCRPERLGACDVDLTTTVIAANGTMTRETAKTDPNAPIDCFYVYPTVSTDPTPNSDMTADPAELNVVRQQFAVLPPGAVLTRRFIGRSHWPDFAHGLLQVPAAEAFQAVFSTMMCGMRGTTTSNTTTKGAESFWSLTLKARSFWTN
jgi:hypothetical protein